MLRRTPAVEFTKHQVALQRPRLGGHARNRGQGFQQLIWVVPMCGPAAPVADNFGIRLLSEDFLHVSRFPGTYGSPFGSHRSRVTRRNRPASLRNTPVPASEKPFPRNIS